MAKAVFLEFEKDLGEIAAKIEKLEAEELEDGKSNRGEIARLEKAKARRTAEIYHELTPWQTALVARHPNRPYTLDYVNAIFEDFHELHGDRTFADDQSIVGGLARLAEHAVMVIGHQKGRDTRERTRRNFGMSKPEGYRKALRLMKLAEKFNLPVFTFVDTPGAYPGIDAEERNQSEAIGRNIFELAKLKVPVIATIIGEGGSGGALAIAVADAVFMLQYSTYSVISPEGCASILWKSASKAPEAAQALGLTAETLKKLGLVDKVISEPIGGAHNDPKLMASTLKKALVDQLKLVKSLSTDELLERRLGRLLNYGRFESDGPNAAACIAALFGDAPQTPAQEAASSDSDAAKDVSDKPAAKKGARSTRTAKTSRTARAARTRKSDAADVAQKADKAAEAPALTPAEAPVQKAFAGAAEAASNPQEQEKAPEAAPAAKPAAAGKTSRRSSAGKTAKAKTPAAEAAGDMAEAAGAQDKQPAAEKKAAAKSGTAKKAAPRAAKKTAARKPAASKTAAAESAPAPQAQPADTKKA